MEIDGLESTFIVKDKMNKRWEKKINIYMGLDEEAAIEWGKKEVEILFVDNTAETVEYDQFHNSLYLRDLINES